MNNINPGMKKKVIDDSWTVVDEGQYLDSRPNTMIIYKIVNSKNSKVYVGKTERSLSIRFNEHIQLSKNSDRPLYRAMRKHGVKNFNIEKLEVCDESNIDEREVHWINFYNSYKNGYNATKGGEGKSLLNYEEVIAIYNELKSVKLTAEHLNCSKDAVSDILKSFSITIVKINTQVKAVEIFDGEKSIGKFESVKLASKFLIEKLNLKRDDDFYVSHIAACCRGTRKSCLGYTFKYV